jgi:uncharacterized protein (DUF2236 family)
MPPRMAFGEPDTETADPGLFGPESMSWRVHSDPAIGIGGLRAILLQAMHPGAMAAAAQTSDYRRDPWGRLARTAEYIGVITYGTTAEAERAAASVRAVHSHLGLDRPEWLLWVHAAFVESLLDSYRRSGAPLSDAEADRYVDEQREAARLIGLDPDEVFDDVASLRDYVASEVPGLAATDEAVDFVRFALVPPMPAKVRWLTPAAPGWATLMGTALALLPHRVRGDLIAALSRQGIPLAGGVLAPAGRMLLGNRLADVQATVTLRGLRIALAQLPESAREGPHLRAARERLAIPTG